MAENKLMITLSHVYKRHGRHPVLNDVSLTVKKGDILGIVGGSGTGKSTLLNIIAGIDHPSDGSVSCSAGRIGYVFQEPRLLPWRTASDNIALALIAGGTAENDAQEQASMWIDRMRLSSFADAYPAQLSGGMRQRVSLARALSINPELLLLDEPFTGLDVLLKDAVFSLIKAHIAEYDTTILYVTHIPDELPRLTTSTMSLSMSGSLEDISLDDIR